MATAAMHPLPAHALDVAAVALMLARRMSVVLDNRTLAQLRGFAWSAMVKWLM